MSMHSSGGVWASGIAGLIVTVALCAPNSLLAKKVKITAEQKAGVVERCGAHRSASTQKTTVSRRASKAGKESKRRRRKSAKSAPKAYLSKWHPDVVIVEDDGSIIQGNDMDTCAAARAYYSRFRDKQHFLFVFGQDGTDLAGGREAYYQSYRNGVQGIGRSIHDHSAECGSKGTLLGIANMNGTRKWAPFAAPLLDLWPSGVIAHEIGHQWISYLDEPVKGVRLSTPNNQYRSHWQPLVDTDASIMYGNNWIKFGKGYKSTSLPSGFSRLDKYLMGLIPASKVKPFIAIDATEEKIKKHYALPGQSAKGKAVTITIEDIQKVYGKRVPDYKKATKDFRAAVILVVPKGKKARRAASRISNYLRKSIARKMKSATNGALKIGTSLTCDEDNHCARRNFCNKGFLGLGQNKCSAKRALKKTCTRSGHCLSGRCSFGFCAKAK